MAAALFVLGRHNYLLFHTLAEFFSITVATVIFVLAWNTRRVLDNGYLLVLGIAFLFIGGLDLVHLMTYKGMGVLPGYDSDVPTQLWIAARSLEALSLLVAPLFLARRVWPFVVMASYAVTVTLVLLSVFWWDIFPACYVEGQGLTDFKVYAEYAICVLLLAGLASLVAQRDRMSRPILVTLCAAIVTAVISELAFTQYVSVYADFNLVGHLLKIASVYLVYNAIAETGLRRPYDLVFRELSMEREALRRSEQALQRTTAELRRSNEDLELFASFASHDLREPLRAIGGFAELVTERYEGKLDARADEYLGFVVDGVRRMDALIRDLLEYSRVGADVAHVIVSTEVCLSAVEKDLTAAIAESGVRIVRTPLPTVRGDAVLIGRVFQNLVANAIKFRGEAPPVIEVGSEPETEFHRFWVADNGIGLPPEQAERIFQPFQRLHGIGAYPGSGLGLAMCRRIVERHGGRIWVESTPGRGSRFYFTLPGVESSPEAPDGPQG